MGSGLRPQACLPLACLPFLAARRFRKMGMSAAMPTVTPSATSFAEYLHSNVGQQRCGMSIPARSTSPGEVMGSAHVRLWAAKTSLHTAGQIPSNASSQV